jgi:signal transduction histidine kinase
MFNLFTPQSKVQKDRQIMRETDMRMAKYSRRGLVTNFLVYLLCLASGEFVEQQFKLALTLTLGLLLLTLLRGYFLFRFETIYPRAPNRWRNIYFLVTLLGAMWWGFITSSVTLALELQYEAPLLWLYTVVFFATTAHAFAPYGKFLTYYQLIGLVPLALSAMMVGEMISVVHGVVMLFFCWILNHQSRTMTANFWDRLEANYILARKTESLEEEKRGTRASVQLNQEYMALLRSELKSLLDAKRQSREETPAAGNLAAHHPMRRPRLLQLYTNVNDFYQVLSKEMVINARIFNLRHQMQNVIGHFVSQAQERNILLESALSPTLPMRLVGDAERLGQVVTILLNAMIVQSEGCQILVEIEFTRDEETEGELHLTLSRQSLATKKLFFQDVAEQPLQMNLELALGKGLADALGGSLDIAEMGNLEGVHLRFRVRLGMAEPAAQMVFQKPCFRGKRLLLVQPNPRLLDIKRHELDAMGFVVFTETQYKKAFAALEDAVSEGRNFDAVVFYLEADDEEALEFAEAILKRNDLKLTQQVILTSGLSLAADRLASIKQSSRVQFIQRPAGAFELETHLQPLMMGRSHAGDSPAQTVQVLLFNADKKQTAGRSFLAGCATVQEVSDTENLLDAMARQQYDMVAFVLDSFGVSEQAIAALRQYEKSRIQEFFIPVLGLGAANQDYLAYQWGVDHFMCLDAAASTQQVAYWSQVFSALHS